MKLPMPSFEISSAAGVIRVPTSCRNTMSNFAAISMENATVPTRYGSNGGDANPPRTEAAALLP